MKGLNQLLDTDIEVVISGDTRFVGTLIDVGQDIFVIFDGCNYLYIPLLHLHQMNKAKIMTSNKKSILINPEDPMTEAETQAFSYRNTLNKVKGQFIEVYVTGGRSIHGYVTNVLNDYIVFFSPVFKILFISMHHLKWFTLIQLNKHRILLITHNCLSCLPMFLLSVILRSRSKNILVNWSYSIWERCQKKSDY